METYNGIVSLTISIILHIIISPLLLIIVLINEIVRSFVSIYLYVKYRGEMKLVSDGADSVWAAKRPGKTRNIIQCQRFSSRFTNEAALEMCKQAFEISRDNEGNLMYEKLQYVLRSRFGFACWKRDNSFNMQNHIRTLEDKVMSREDFKEFLRQLEKDMPKSRPQWELIIVPRYRDEEYEEESAWFISRFHHSYLDGLSIVTLAKNHFSTGFEFYLDPFTFQVSTWQMYLYYMSAVLFAPYASLYILRNWFREQWPLRHNQLEQLSPELPEPQRNYTWSSEISLDSIKTIRLATNRTSVSSVIENAFIAASQEVLPENRLPTAWEIAELAAMLPYPDCKPRNRFSAFMYTIDSTLEHFKRLEHTKNVASESMKGPFIPMGYFLFKFLGRMQLFFHVPFLKPLTCSMCFSNVPASKTKYKGIQGIDVIQLLAFPPHAVDTGIIVCNVSLEKFTRVTVTAESCWIQREELEDIVKRIPGIIESWAEKAKTTSSRNLENAEK